MREWEGGRRVPADPCVTAVPSALLRSSLNQQLTEAPFLSQEDVSSEPLQEITDFTSGMICLHTSLTRILKENPNQVPFPALLCSRIE